MKKLFFVLTMLFSVACYSQKDTGVYDRILPPNNKRWETTGVHHENVFYLVDSMTAFVRANTHLNCECPAWGKYLDSLPRIKITSELKSMLQSLNYYYGDEVMPGEIFEVVARPTKEMLIEFPVSPIIDITMHVPYGGGFTEWTPRKDTIPGEGPEGVNPYIESLIFDNSVVILCLYEYSVSGKIYVDTLAVDYYRKAVFLNPINYNLIITKSDLEFQKIIARKLNEKE